MFCTLYKVTICETQIIWLYKLIEIISHYGYQKKIPIIVTTKKYKKDATDHFPSK